MHEKCAALRTTHPFQRKDAESCVDSRYLSKCIRIFNTLTHNGVVLWCWASCSPWHRSSLGRCQGRRIWLCGLAHCSSPVGFEFIMCTLICVGCLCFLKLFPWFHWFGGQVRCMDQIRYHMFELIFSLFFYANKTVIWYTKIFSWILEYGLVL